MNKKNEVLECGYVLLSAGWRKLDELPNWYSFRCIIKLEEFGIDGENNKYVCMGFWSHNENRFWCDSADYANMTPNEWIPLYDIGI